MRINNLPDYYTGYPYTVARLYEGEYWFYGSYRTAERAYEVAEAEGGQVFPVDIIVDAWKVGA